MALGDGRVCWAEGRLTQSDGIRARRFGDGLPNGKRGRSADARDRGWRSAFVTTVNAGVGRGVTAPIANGDGADAGVARGSRSSPR